MNVIVLDTCAFLTQKHPNGEFATVPGIKNEIVNKQSKQYFENMLATNLKIMKAEKSSYEIELIFLFTKNIIFLKPHVEIC